MGNLQQRQRNQATVPYHVQLEIYNNLIAAINKAEQEEIYKRAPSGVCLIVYWFQNIIALPEGLLRLTWHFILTMLLSLVFFCFYQDSSAASPYRPHQHQHQQPPPAPMDIDEMCCAVPMFFHHKSMVWMYLQSLRYILQNIFWPCQPLYFTEMYIPIERPAPPPPPRETPQFSGDCFEVCLQQCFYSLFQSCMDECCKCCYTMVHKMADWAMYVTMRLTRSMYCAFSCFWSCHGSVCLGPCWLDCRQYYDTLPMRIARWTEEREEQVREATLKFYQTNYGCENYDQYKQLAFSNYLHPPEAQRVVPETEFMEGRDRPLIATTVNTGNDLEAAEYYTSKVPTAPPGPQQQSKKRLFGIT